MIAMGSLLALFSLGIGFLVVLDALIRVIESLSKSPKNWLPNEEDSGARTKEGAKETSCSIVYATQTGTAESFARSLKSQLEAIYGENNDIFLRDVEHYSSERIAGENLIVFVVATYGEGGPTDSAEELHAWLKRVEGGEENKSLEGVKYAVFGLGNSQYERFCEMGKLVDRCMKKLGATPVARLGLGDGFRDTQMDFEDWTQDFLSCVQFSNALRSGKELEVSADTVASYVICPAQPSEVVDELPSGDGTGKDNSLLAPITMIKEMYGKDSDRHCVHVEFDLSGSRISYEVGDHVGVYGANSPDTVSKVATLLQMSPDYAFVMEKDPKSGDLLEPFTSRPITLGFALTHYVDVLSSPSKGALRALSAFVEDDEEKQKVLYLSQQDGCQEYQDTIIKKKKSLLEFMQEIPSAKPTLGAFLGSIAPRLKPRYYSISSSPMLHPRSMHITCAVVQDTTPTGRVHHGIASAFLQSCTVGDKIRIYHRSSAFKLPESGHGCPIIMVGPGTGIAPFRGFIQERQYAMERGQTVGEALLFFGCRHRDQDYLYRQELENALQSGALTDLIVAFSRETTNKIYVQDKIRENQEAILDLLFTRNSHLYICGSSKMSDDVIDTIIGMIQKKKKCSLAEACNLFQESLIQQKRLSKDVW